MNVLKRTIALFSVLSLLFLCSCEKKVELETTEPQTEQSTENPEDSYYTYAVQCLSKGDTAGAKTVLEEGIRITKSEKLKELLDSIPEETSATTTEAPTTQATTTKIVTTTQIADYSKYITDYCDDLGGAYLNIDYITPSQAMFDLEIRTSESGRTASVEDVVGTVNNKTITAHYYDDGWGHEGTITLKLDDKGNYIDVDVTVDNYVPSSMFGLAYNGRVTSTYVLYGD